MHSDRSRNETRLTLTYAVLLGAMTVGYRLVSPYLLGPGSHFAWNLMPVGALALFAGARLRSRWAWLVPLGAMLASDLLLIPHYARMGIASMAWATTPFIYASFALYALLGKLVKPGIDSPVLLVGTAVAGGVQFFLLTNFAVWAFEVLPSGEPLYAKTLPGLLERHRMKPEAEGQVRRRATGMVIVVVVVVERRLRCIRVEHPGDGAGGGSLQLAEAHPRRHEDACEDEQDQESGQDRHALAS